MFLVQFFPLLLALALAATHDTASGTLTVSLIWPLDQLNCFLRPKCNICIPHCRVSTLTDLSLFDLFQLPFLFLDVIISNFYEICIQLFLFLINLFQLSISITIFKHQFFYEVSCILILHRAHLNNKFHIFHIRFTKINISHFIILWVKLIQPLRIINIR